MFLDRKTAKMGLKNDFAHVCWQHFPFKIVWFLPNRDMKVVHRSKVRYALHSPLLLFYSFLFLLLLFLSFFLFSDFFSFFWFCSSFSSLFLFHTRNLQVGMLLFRPMRSSCQYSPIKLTNVQRFRFITADNSARLVCQNRSILDAFWHIFSDLMPTFGVGDLAYPSKMLNRSTATSQANQKHLQNGKTMLQISDQVILSL